TIYPLSGILLERYSRSNSSADNVISSPDRSTTTVLSRTSFISPPYAPAFIYKAPPTDPGIPQENSSPVNVLANASLETSIIPHHFRQPLQYHLSRFYLNLLSSG